MSDLDPCKCPKCSELFNEDSKAPRNLSCGHTFCHQCLLKIHEEGDTRCKIQCPDDHCDKKTSLPKGDISILSKNHIVLMLLRQFNEPANKRRKVEKEEDSEDGPLTPIQSGPQCANNPGHLATVTCDSCKEENGISRMKFCESCFSKLHKNAHAFHKKMPIDEKMIYLPQCPRHPHQMAEFICQDDRCQNKMAKEICELCRSEDHAEHKIERLADLLFKFKEDAKPLINRITDRQKQIEALLQDREKNLKNNDLHGKTEYQKIQDYFEVLKEKHIQKLAKFVESEHQRINMDIANIEADKKTCDKAGEELAKAASADNSNLALLHDALMTASDAIAKELPFDANFTAKCFQFRKESH